MNVILRYSLLLTLAIPATLGFAAESDPNAVVAEWNFEQDAEGWKSLSECQLSADNGVLRIVGTGNDPHFGTDLQAPAGWKQLTMRVRFRGRYEGQLFWGTSQTPGFSEARTVGFGMRGADREWREVDVYFHPEAELTTLRIDPNNGKCRLEIDWIKLTNAKPPEQTATPVADMKLLPGFQAELLYSVPKQEQGSWVSLTHDDKGRLIASDQYGKLYRVTPSAAGEGADGTKVDPLEVDMGMAHGLLYAFDSLYTVVNGGRERTSGLYRLRDTNGDDKFDEVKLLREIQGQGEHGPHAVILGPDGKSIYMAAGNHTDLPEIQNSLVPRNWQEDQLLPRMWDARGHAVGRLAPGGWIMRFDPDGTEFELVSIGFRNQYDIAFNPEGELFTYDADMEWDIGTPWYRPTRVNHVTSGSEFGWRSGTGKWPAYYPDSLPAVVDIGPGSPTGVHFGTGAKFPEKYQRALFISDWSYGILYAVHLTPDGATYSGQPEVFATAAPLPITDVIVNPHDGAMYFTIGGRNTQSGLYRITYTGDQPTAPAQVAQDNGSEARQLRRRLETLHGDGAAAQGEEAVQLAWPYLSHEDRFVRYAARVAIEHQPVDTWQQRALDEQNPRALIQATIALARNGDPSLQPQIIESLGRIDWNELPTAQQLALLRAYSLTFIRLGEPSEEDRSTVVERLNSRYPARDSRLNRELSQLLVYLRAPGVAQKTLDLLASAPTQEEQIHYVLALRNLREGWTLEQRKQYFQWFHRASGHQGGMSFGGFLQNIRGDAVGTLTDDEQAVLKPLLEAPTETAEPVETGPPREFVQKWTVDSLLPAVDSGLQNRDFSQGRQIFAAASCFKCHRFAGEGGTIGPDLSGVGGRFNSRDLLESIIEPDKVISDQYQPTTFLLDNGMAVTGRIINLAGNDYRVLTDMLNPSNLTSINRDEIEEMMPARTSLMPSGLLDTFTKEEVLDLIAYLRSGGNPDHPAFAR